MKKLLSMGLLTVCALAVAEQRAQAWVNSKFSIGFNWQLQSANNSLLWGVFKNGQVPGPEAFGMPAHPGHGHGGHFGPGGGYMPPAAQQYFPYFGGGPNYNQMAPAGYPHMQPGYQPPAPQSAPASSPVRGAPASYNPYQNVSYQYPYSAYYPYGSTYPYAVPHYWYQGQ